MNKYWIAGIGLGVAGIAWYAYAGLVSPGSPGSDDKPGRPAGVEPAPSPPRADAPSKESGNSAGMAAVRRASDAGKHLFIFVHHGDSAETREIRGRFESAISKIGDSVQWTALDRNNPSERELVEKFELGRAPVPIVLALAPNGAITAGIRTHELTEEKLRNSIASPILQKCLKSLQDGRLVFLCVRAKSTPSDDPSWRGINEFKEDERFARFTDIVQVDPAEGTEKKLLKEFEIDPDSTEPTTVLLVPPGTVAAKVAGPTNKEDLVRALRSASSGTG